MSAEQQDAYAELGEFHDLFMETPWEHLRPHLRDELAGLDAQDVVVDVGAGTGMGTRVVAAECPAEVVALEPSLLMRSVLTARVADDPGLQRRVTVVAGGVPDGLGELPDRCAAVVCAHALGGIRRAARTEFYEWLRDHLDPLGAALVTVHQPGGKADEVSELTESRRVGRYRYEVRYESAGAGRFASRYQVSVGARVVREKVFVDRWEPLTAADVDRESAAAGLVVEPVTAGLVRLRTAAR